MVEETVLVTGGCGFIGLRLVAALRAAHHSVRILDIPRTDHRRAEALGAKVTQGSVADGESVRLAVGNSRVVFHLVAPDPSIRDERFLRKMMVGGTDVLMEELEDSKVRHVVATSTVGVVAQGDGVRTEADPVKPGTLHERVGADMERHLRRGAEDADVAVTATVLRLPNVYGRGDAGIVDRLVPHLRAGGEVIIPDKGWVSTVHVDDVVAAAMRIATPPTPGDGGDDKARFTVFNCVDGTPTTPQELVSVVARAIGVPPPRLHRPGLLGDARGPWTDKDRPVRLVELSRYTSQRLRGALPDWPSWPSLEIGLTTELDG